MGKKERTIATGDPGSLLLGGCLPPKVRILLQQFAAATRDSWISLSPERLGMELPQLFGVSYIPPMLYVNSVGFEDFGAPHVAVATTIKTRVGEG